MSENAKSSGSKQPLLFLVYVYAVATLLVSLAMISLFRIIAQSYTYLGINKPSQPFIGLSDLDSILLTVSICTSSVALVLIPMLLKIGLGNRYPINRSLFTMVIVFFLALGVSRLSVAASLWLPVLILTEVLNIIAAGICIATASVAFLIGRMLRDLPTEIEINDVLLIMAERRKTKKVAEL